ncbi:MAG: helix-hairpin-helix domain-containing protein [Bacteroidales bacterium]
MNSLLIRQVWLLGILLPLTLQAQVADTLTRELRGDFERLTELTETEYDFSEYTEEIESLSSSPVNLNSRDPEELRRLFFLNDLHIRNILKYTASFGDFQSIYELKLVEGFDSLTIKKMLPFITILPARTDDFALREALKRGKNQVLFRFQQVLEKQEGYKTPDDSLIQVRSNSFYKGSPERLLFKYQYDYRGRLRYGLLGEKDPGEEFFKGSNRQGFDFYSAHFFYAGKGLVKRVACGDYHASFGQGLVMWSGLMFGKASLAGGNPSPARGIRPSSSANEFAYLRGGAITLGKGAFELTALAARNALDGTTAVSDSLGEFIRSLQTTGLHRTPAEIAAKNNYHLTTLGGNLDFTSTLFKAGITAVAASFDKEFQPQTDLYRRFQHPLRKQFTTGIHISVFLRDLIFKGEMARDINGHLAGIVHTTFQPDPRLSLWIIYRNYDKAFQNYFSNAFGENTGVYNEEGLYLGFRAALSRKIEMTGYADYFRFPWFRYRVDGPSVGREYFLRTDIKLSRNTLIYLRYRFKIKDINSTDSLRPVNIIASPYYHNLRFHADYQPIATLSLASRAEVIFNHPAAGNRRQGFLIYQELVWTPTSIPLSLAARYALFDTDTYDERLYTYERDLRYSFSIPAYYYNGQRFYLMIKYSPFPWVDLWIRYASTYYANTESVGTGPDASQGNTRSDIRVQLLLKF